MRIAPQDEDGQATVEFVALAPLLVIIVLGLWQAAVAGQAVWLAGAAARAGARAEAIGGDPVPAARAALPRRLEEGLRVRAVSGGGVAVSLQIPAVIGDRALARTIARARFVSQRP